MWTIISNISISAWNLDYDDITKCVDTLCKQVPLLASKMSLTNNYHNLSTYLDCLRDLGALIYNVNIKAYESRTKWAQTRSDQDLTNQSA